ncbi:hypothetical protein C4573_05895 [Candidatus Woesearchaeota archaeon]|nr:MAG: hypothetical protein C4573_05895 [Candidatus Woesearchaeota archaeon]
MNLITGIEAILARDKGMPFHEVLSEYGITAKQFTLAFFKFAKVEAYRRNIPDFLRESIDVLLADPQRTKELFRMEPDYLHQQYDDLMSGECDKFDDGAFSHPENVKHIVYYALGIHTPLLDNPDRKAVLEGLRSLPYSLADHFIAIGLEGLLNTMKRSPLKLIQVFDQAYQDATGDKSLFDLKQETHMHFWDFALPKNYWTAEKKEEAVYHLLTEQCPLLASEDRTAVLNELAGVQLLTLHELKKIGLRKIIEYDNSCSVAKIMDIFNAAYQKKTNLPSLFATTA